MIITTCCMSPCRPDYIFTLPFGVGCLPFRVT
ncbi:hypothetical protein [Pseudomonas phage PhiPizzaParty]|nr:hypothetical protein [Pseudomonas phage PhiPizzaParty]